LLISPLLVSMVLLYPVIVCEFFEKCLRFIKNKKSHRLRPMAQKNGSALRALPLWLHPADADS